MITRKQASRLILEVLLRADVTAEADRLASEIVEAILGPSRKATTHLRSTCVGCGRIKVRVRDFRSDPKHRAEGCVPHGQGGFCHSCRARQLRGVAGPCDPSRRWAKPSGNGSPVRAFPISPSLVMQLRTADPEFKGGAA